MNVPIPDVPNAYYNKPYNFKLVIYAYRKLSAKEIKGLAELYRCAYCGGTYPRNATHKFMFTAE